MKFPEIKTFAAISLITAASLLTACGGSSSGGGDKNPDEGTQAYVDDNMALKGDFAEDVTLTAGMTYAIDGEVNFLEGTTLTIPAGTTLYGASGSSFLAINRGAMIMADGTAESPIIFTSALDVANDAVKNAQGLWGGVSIFGKAQNNTGEETYEAGEQLFGPVDGVATNDDNSGILDYVIIKHTGYEVEANKELNGLSLGSVGSGTQISNIAVIGSSDDGIEFWGGTVDVENLYIYNAADDSLDTDHGYTGTLTNVYVQQVIVDDEIDSRAIEADSLNSTETGTPASKPTLINATLDTIGRAVRLREGTGYVFDNVQINVKSSSFMRSLDGTRIEDTNGDPILDEDGNEQFYDYHKDIAAIRVSDTGITGGEIEVASGGLAIKNDAVELIVNDEMAGDIGADGLVTSGLGMYRDSGTLDIFRAQSDVHEVVGVSGDMVDEGFLDSDGNAFAAEVDADNTVTGADVSTFEWVLEEINSVPTTVLSGDITSDMTLTADTLWALNGTVSVVDGVTLTIDPGTTLFGVTGSSYMVINQGAMIMAQGTATAPIVFTSAQDIAGLNTGDEQGQWGGLTLLGKASANKGNRTYEAASSEEQLYGPDGTGVVGTTCPAGTPVENCGIDDDNSGTLTYVVVKYTGYEVEKDKELNGISLAAVGSGTTIMNVASIGSADDGIEFWGGTVSVDGLYVYNAGDDSIDTDQGYVGTISNVYAEQNVVDDEEGSRVIEADGHSSTEIGTPASLVTMEDAILKSVGRAIRLREGTGYIFDNVQVTVESSTDPDMAAVRISDDPTFTNAMIDTAGEGLAIKNTVNTTALYRDTATQDYFQALTDPAVLEDDDTTLSITEYDRSWIPDWTL